MAGLSPTMSAARPVVAILLLMTVVTAATGGASPGLDKAEVVRCEGIAPESLGCEASGVLVGPDVDLWTYGNTFVTGSFAMWVRTDTGTLVQDCFLTEASLEPGGEGVVFCYEFQEGYFAMGQAYRFEAEVRGLGFGVPVVGPWHFQFTNWYGE